MCSVSIIAQDETDAGIEGDCCGINGDVCCSYSPCESVSWITGNVFLDYYFK